MKLVLSFAFLEPKRASDSAGGQPHSKGLPSSEWQVSSWVDHSDAEHQQLTLLSCWCWGSAREGRRWHQRFVVLLASCLAGFEVGSSMLAANSWQQSTIGEGIGTWLGVAWWIELKAGWIQSIQ